jgi:hypothetical protein
MRAIGRKNPRNIWTAAGIVSLTTNCSHTTAKSDVKGMRKVMRRMDSDVRGGSTMSRKFSFVTVVLAAWAALLLVVLLVGAPALAHHKSDHANGGGGKASAQGGGGSSDNDGDANSDAGQITENNDSNDGDTPNNVADGGDNAHPSGKDRSVEGDSGNQGNAESNPDDTNGPQRCEGVCGDPDKADGYGGEDYADQDGNNGCGNDDDFDDDNNGWCGKPEDNQVTQPPPPPTVTVEVGGDVIGQVPNLGAPVAADVLGKRVVRGRPEVQAERAVLPFTGGNFAGLLILGLGLMTTGGLLVRRSR